MRKRLIIFSLFLISFILVAVLYQNKGDTRSLRGSLIFAVDTRLPNQTLAGIRSGVKVGTGKGVWIQPLEGTSPKAKVLQPCSENAWCVNTDSPNYVVFGCGDSGVLYNVRDTQTVHIGVPAGERIVAFSLRENYAFTILEERVYIRFYKIVDNRIVWSQIHPLENIPKPKTIHFAPKGSMILMESGGWVYVLPAIRQKAKQTYQGRALGWSPDGTALVYIPSERLIIKYYPQHGSSFSVISIPKGETPVAISPDGLFVLTKTTYLDVRRLLPEVQAFRIRSLKTGKVQSTIDAGWGVGNAYWVNKY